MRKEQARAISAGIAITALSLISLLSPVLLGFMIGRWTA